MCRFALQALLMTQYAGHRAILLRIAFVLGNLTTQSQACREQMAVLPGALDSVVILLHTYTSPPHTSPPASATPSCHHSSTPSPSNAKTDRCAGRGACEFISSVISSVMSHSQEL